jgi:UDP-N-acetylmuramoylalanine--D-glutamate ligase
VTDFTGRRIAVIGAAKTGVAVAKALIPRGARVHVYDRSTTPEMMAAAVELRALGAGVTLGADEGPELCAADIIIPSPGVPKTSPVLIAAKDRGQRIWSEPEVAWCVSRGKILAVTGTNGKTTTTALLGAMLSDAGLDARVGGNIAPGRPLIEIADEAPESAVLVAEISSFQLEWIDGFCPKVGILTNLTEDHLNRHGTMDEYGAMKARLFENQTASEHTVVNADNAPARAIGEASRGTLWMFSRREEVARGAFLRDGKIVLRDGEQETDLIEVARIRLPGRHNHENAMAAALAAKIMGADADNLIHTLTRFAGVEHRMEWVANIGGADWVNNSMCTNPAALVSSMEAYDRPLIVIVGGADKDLDFAEVPAAFGARCKAVLTIGSFGPEFSAMARAGGVPHVEDAGTLDNAVAAAARLAQPGDVVMLVPGCASFDQFRSFEDRGHQFKAAVKEMMNAE